MKDYKTPLIWIQLGFTVELQCTILQRGSSRGMQFMQTCMSFILWQLQKSCSANKTQGFLFLTIPRIDFKSRLPLKSRTWKKSINVKWILRPSEITTFLFMCFYSFYRITQRKALKNFVKMYFAVIRKSCITKYNTEITDISSSEG